MNEFSVKLTSAKFGVELFEIVAAADASSAGTAALARHPELPDAKVEWATPLVNVPLPA